MSMPRRILSAKEGSSIQKKTIRQGKRFDRTYTEHSDGMYRGSWEANELSLRKDKSKMISGSKLQHRPSKVIKEPEEMIEQNMSLKMFVNQLQGQLHVQKFKIEAQKKKNYHYTKQLSREFQKQIYYSGKNPNSHLITGVKHQYEQMKQLFQQKCEQNELIKRNIENSNLEEMKIYTETLEIENKLLSDKLIQFIRNKDQIVKSFEPQLTSPPKSTKKTRQKHSLHTKSYLEEPIQNSFNKNTQILSSMLSQAQLNNEKANQIIEKYHQKIKDQNSQLVQLSKKIKFLEKMIIEKDNDEYAIKKKMKVIQKEKYGQFLKNHSLFNQTEKLKKQHQIQIRKIIDRENKKYQIEKDIFDNILKQKSSRVQNLQKQIRYLTTLLSYWKPLDEIQRDYSNLRDGTSSMSKQLERQNTKLSFNIKEVQRQESLRESPFVSKKQSRRKLEVSYHSEQKGRKRSSSQSQALKTLEMCESQRMVRQPFSSEVKNSENGKRLRKVEPRQFSYIGQLLKYRLIGYKIEMEEAKSYLNYKFKQDSCEDETEQSIKAQFISMKQINQILTKHPFFLTSEQALSLSRYCVEDTSNQYVYCDDINEVSRNVCKSIFRAFVGDYEIIKEEQLLEEWMNIKKVYASNLQLALGSIAPKGFIDLQKFLELINGLGIEMSDYLQNWIISNMTIKSQSLQKLQYKVLFE